MPTAQKRSQQQRDESKRSRQGNAGYPAIRKRLQDIRAEAEWALSEIDRHEQESLQLALDRLAPEAVEIGAAFKTAADRLLVAIEETLAEMRAEREKTRALLDRLDRQLTSHG